jgi:hypothetical protein
LNEKIDERLIWRRTSEGIGEKFEEIDLLKGLMKDYLVEELLELERLCSGSRQIAT